MHVTQLILKLRVDKNDEGLNIDNNNMRISTSLI